MFHPTLSKSGRILFAPVIKLCEFIGVHFPVMMVQIRYFACFGRLANLRHPKDLNEKILYYKLFKDTSRWADLADKFKVRQHVENVAGKDVLVPLYGYWYSVEDFKRGFVDLPDSFILKANNGDGKGTNLIVRNKNEYTGRKFDELCKTVKWWLSRKNIGAVVAEPHYKHIVPCVVAEELLPADDGHVGLTDYKIWCFEGNPRFIRVCGGRNKGGNSYRVMTYDTEWNPHPEYAVYSSDQSENEVMPKPANLGKMIALAARLSSGFPELRVDLYNVKGKIYFGELTFTSTGGIMSYYTQEFLDMCGAMFDVESLDDKK